MTSLDARIGVMRQTALFSAVDDDAIGRLARQAREKRLERNEILFTAGEPAEGLYIVAEGSVRAFRSTSDGREQVIHVEKAITTLAEVPVFDDGNYPSTVAAEEPTLVYFLAKDLVMQTALEHPALAISAVRLFASRLRRCAELVETLGLREVGQRLGIVLLEEARVHGVNTPEGVKVTLRSSHNQLAARVGTVREVVTRSLIRLQNQGLLIHRGKSYIIPDLALLEAYAELPSGVESNNTEA